MRVLNHLVCFGTLTVVVLLAMAAGAYGGESMDVRIERKTCLAEDGVLIVYSAAGAGDPALIFIHGGLADRTFWEGQLSEFAGLHRVNSRVFIESSLSTFLATESQDSTGKNGEFRNSALT